MTIIGAATPIWSTVGMNPTPAVAIPIKVTVTRKVYLRPNLSPKNPNKIAPIGRKANPTAKVDQTNKSPKVGSSTS